MANEPKEVEGVVVLKEDDQAMVHQMLAAFYSNSYDEYFHPPQGAYEFNARLYAMADKYGIEFVHQIAKNKVLIALHQFHPSEVEDFVKAIKVAYTTTLDTDRGLRTVLLRGIQRYNYELLQYSDYRELLKSGLADGGFVMDVNAALTMVPLRPRGFAQMDGDRKESGDGDKADE